jgi:tetratricopeptide (TPR) repeat protein
MTYRSGNDRNLRSIANALGVANVVEGTVRRYGNRVRVTTKLVDARTDKTLWSDSYDRDSTDIFAIQSEIARTVASQLSAQMSPEEKQNIAQRPTNDLEAYDLYLQAKALIVNSAYEEDALGTLLNALRLLEEVVRKDPEFALAHCLVARAHDYLKLLGDDQTLERRALGDAAVNEALRWGPNLPEVHLAIAFHRYLWYHDYERARVQLAIVEQTFPNNPEAIALAAYLDRHQGNWDKSTRDLERAIALDPRNPEFLLSAKRDAATAQRFLSKALSCENHPEPRVINSDKHAAYPPAIAVLQAAGDLADNCQHRPVQNLNNVLEQDHRAIKRRINASQHFHSFWCAWRTIAGYEAIHMIRKGQAYGSAAGAKVGLVHRFILGLFAATN